MYFSNFTDLRVYSVDLGSEKRGEPVAVTSGKSVLSCASVS